MKEALLSLAVQSLPYLAPLLLGLLGLAAAKLWKVITFRVNNTAARQALESLGTKATTIAQGLEQTMRPQLAAATADGKLSREEAAQLAAAAMRELLELAGAELGILRRSQGLTDAQTQRVAQLAMESAVFQLPRSSNRIGRPGSATGAMVGHLTGREPL